MGRRGERGLLWGSALRRGQLASGDTHPTAYQRKHLSTIIGVDGTMGIIAAISVPFGSLRESALRPLTTLPARVVLPLPGMPETLIRMRESEGAAESFSVKCSSYHLCLRRFLFICYMCIYSREFEENILAVAFTRSSTTLSMVFGCIAGVVRLDLEEQPVWYLNWGG